MKNFGLLIISFIIAICLMFIVNDRSGTSSTNLVVPVVTSNLPTDKIVVSTSKSQVQVTIKGPSYLLNNISRTGVNLNIKFPDNVSNAYSRMLSPSDLHLPTGVEVLNIEPHELSFTIDNLVSKRVPVVVPRIGSLDNAYRLVEFKVEPEAVELVGSEIELRGIKRVQTESVDLRNITSSTVQDVKLRQVGSFVKANSEMVKVNIIIRDVQDTKEIKGLNIEIRNEVNKQFDVNYKTVDVMVKGAKKDIKVLNANKVRPFIKIDEEASKNKQANLEFELPDGISLFSSNPKNVSLKEK
ncbi:MAG: YbbR-like domain-containing protein [Bdellovibrionota bacterium]